MFKKNFYLEDEIVKFNITNFTTKSIIEFYNTAPFPYYKKDDNKHTIVEIGERNIFTKHLKEFIGFNKNIIEIGAGTCQLSNYLAIGTNNQVFALDPTLKSLNLGKDFAKKNNIKNTTFVNADIFDDVLKDESFDFILCNGVLHHTKEPYKAFTTVLKSLKKDGYIILGLYNKFGRIRTILRRALFKVFGKKIVMILDPVLRSLKSGSEDKINSWIRDQYIHPVESTHTFDEVLTWFKKNNVELINSIPNTLRPTENKISFFEKKRLLNYFERIFQQFIMIFDTFGAEGGLFIFIGKKN